MNTDKKKIFFNMDEGTLNKLTEKVISFTFSVSDALYSGFL